MSFNTCPLRIWRLQQSPPWSRLQLARKLNLSKWAIILWENGKRRSTQDRWQEVTHLTGIAWKDWLTWYESD